MNLGEHASDNTANPGQVSSGLSGSIQPKSSPPEVQKDLYEEVRGLRLELEQLREQTALQRTAQPHEADTGDAENPTDRPEPRDRAVGAAHRRRPLRLILSLVSAALLCVGGMRLWNYVQSYEWTDDAEVDGHLDPISTRINDTVVAVPVENTYHVKKGQPLVDLDPRDYQVAVENAAANLAQAQQAVEAAQQNYDLSVANLAAAKATNAKAQLDVGRYSELLRQEVIARETYDEIIRVGKVDAAAVNSDRAAVAAAARMIGQAKAAVQAAQASLDQAKLNLSYTHIVAPATGVVGDKTVQVGQRVQPGEHSLLSSPSMISGSPLIFARRSSAGCAAASQSRFVSTQPDSTTRVMSKACPARRANSTACYLPKTPPETM